MTKEFPMTNAEFSLITRASGGESRGLPSRRQRGFHRLATLCWERIGHWGYWSFTGHCGIGHWPFAPNANPLEMSKNRLFHLPLRPTPWFNAVKTPAWAIPQARSASLG